MDVISLLADLQRFHSNVQMDSFITIRNGGTVYGCYKQALAELDTRYRNLRDRYLDQEELELTRDEFLEKQDNLHGVKLRRNEIRLKRIENQITDLELVIKDTEREFLRFYAQAAALKEYIGELTESRRDELELEFWVHSAKCRCAVDYISRGVLSEAVVTLVASLPQPARAGIMQELKDPQRMIDWFNAYVPNHIAPIAVDTIHVRQIIER